MYNLNKLKVNLFFPLILLVIFLNLSFVVLAETDCSTISDEEDKKKCEEGLEKKDDYKEKIDEIVEQKEELEKNLSDVQKSLLSTQESLNQTKKEIDNKLLEIEKQDKQIDLLDQKNEIYQKALASTLRDFYYSQQNGHAFFSVLNNKNSGFLSSENNLSILQGEILDLSEEISKTKSLIQKKKDELEIIKGEQLEDLLEKESQQRVLMSEKKQTQNELYTKEATISELNAKLAKVDADISSLLGGSVKEGDIISAAEFASKKTGVRKSFILGMLVVETDLGRYTGGCTFTNSRMSEPRKKLFIQIADKLGYNYKKLKVSCPPSNYKGSGGAMGVAQFMSDTWIGYESRIAKNTGHKNPDPWKLNDGVMAMALKLANDGALNGESGECTAAKRYLGGNHQWYCDKVLYWAKNYKDKL